MFLHAAHVTDLNAALAAIDRDADRRLAVIGNRIRSRSTHQLRTGVPLDLSAEHVMLADLIERVMMASHLRAWGIHRPAYALARTEIDKALSQAPQHVKTALRELYGSIARSVSDKPMSVVRERLLTHAKDIATGKKGKGGNIRAAVKDSGIEFEDTPVLRTVVRTQGAIAFNAATFEAGQTNDEVWGYQYMTQADERVRLTHREFEPNGVGVRYRFDDPFWDRYAPPNGWNSFLPFTEVSGRFDAASKARYSGPIVQIDTLRGNRLTVTINHPVLTPHGFIPAGDLRQGNYLVAHGSNVESFSQSSGQDVLAFPFVPRRAIHNQHRPPTIEEVYDSFARNGILSTFPGCGSMDFHGDGRFMYSQIDVVIPNCVLPSDVEFSAAKHSTQFNLMLRTNAPLPFNPSNSVPRSGRYVSSGEAAKLDAACDQSLSNSCTRGVKLLRQLEQRHPGSISLDEIVDVQVSSWSGHVYDLQSPNGWIVAGGVICSNCRCGLRLIFRGDKDARKREFKGTPDVPESFQFNPGQFFSLVQATKKKQANRGRASAVR